MVLLSQMMRAAAITGRTDTINAWFAGRQGGRWAEQTIRAAFQAAAPDAQTTPPAGGDPAPGGTAVTLRELTELHQRGHLTDAEFEGLRARLRV
jgi:hypothetical protein